MDRAKTLKLGDREVPRIGLGTNRLRHIPENLAFLQEAVAAGLRHIDTAHLYADGESEAAIGESGIGGEAIVATKGGFNAGEGRPDTLRAQIDESLRRLRTDAIELYYLHRVHPDTPLEDSLRVIAEYRDAGKIRHVGISEVGIEQIERARAAVPITAVQNRFNLSDRQWDGEVDYCAAEGIVFVPFFPLRGENAAVGEIAARHGATPHQIMLAWLLRRSPTMLPIPGTLSLEHLKENLQALEIELDDSEFETLRRA